MTWATLALVRRQQGSGQDSVQQMFVCLPCMPLSCGHWDEWVPRTVELCPASTEEEGKEAPWGKGLRCLFTGKSQGGFPLQERKETTSCTWNQEPGLVLSFSLPSDPKFWVFLNCKPNSFDETTSLFLISQGLYFAISTKSKLPWWQESPSHAEGRGHVSSHSSAQHSAWYLGLGGPVRCVLIVE